MPLLAILLLTLNLQTPDVIERADRLFSYGENKTRDREALGILESAANTNSSDYQLLWRAARAAYYTGNYEKAIANAESAVRIDPKRPEGHFWLGAGYGGLAEQRGMFKAVSLIGKVRSEMETVVRISPGYEDARGYLALCELDRQVPWLLGGNTKRAVGYCEQGIKLAPANLELKLALARAYDEVGRRADARKQIEELLALPVNPMRATSDRGVKEEARRLAPKL